MATIQPLPPSSGTDPASEQEDVLLCPTCGYDLRATAGDRCSECGNIFDRQQLAASQIPWAHRREIGRIRAYLKTVWLFTVGSKKLAHEAHRPQDPSDAVRFRLVTASIVSVVYVGVFVASVIAGGGMAALAFQPSSVYVPPGNNIGWLADLALPWSAAATFPPTLPLMLILLALYLTGVPGYLFRVHGASANRQQRLFALARYTSAPMVWLLPTAVLAALLSLPGALHLAPPKNPLPVWFFLFIVVWLLLLALAGLLGAFGTIGPIARAVQWSVRVRHAGIERTMLSLVQLLGLWLLGIFVFLGLLPWAAGYVWLVIDSLR